MLSETGRLLPENELVSTYKSQTIPPPDRKHSQVKKWLGGKRLLKKLLRTTIPPNNKEGNKTAK